MAAVDHFMYAVPALAEGMNWALDTFGVQPKYGGAHVGLGTCNALLSLGETYLEIIAPDPQQGLAQNFGAHLAALPAGGLVTWAARGHLPSLAATLAQQGIPSRGPSRTQRQSNDGSLLVWDLLFPKTSHINKGLPFFIDWLDCPHPASSNPMGGTLSDFVVTSPHAEVLQILFDALELQVAVVSGPFDLQVDIEAPTGAVTLTTTEATRALSFG